MGTKLRLEERLKIHKFRRMGAGIREIARTLCRSPSTISEELKRNGSVMDRNTDYIEQAHRAQEQAAARRSRASSRMRLKNLKIREYVECQLKMTLSPELIAGRLSIDHPEEKICGEAIYQWLLHERSDLREYLLIAGKTRRRRVAGRQRRLKSPAAPKRSIEERPAEANARTRIGDFEHDSIVSRKSKAALMNITDRKTRRVFLNKVPNLTAEAYSPVLIERLKGQVPEKHRHTLTSDNGGENSAHSKIDAALGTISYHCHPYCSTERGTVENRNGLVRWFFPKGTDFNNIPDDQVQFVEDLINNRPMKCLGFYTPNEIWGKEISMAA